MKLGRCMAGDKGSAEKASPLLGVLKVVSVCVVSAVTMQQG